MPLTNAEQLRINIGERIPQGGADVDTLFTDEEIDAFVDKAGGDEYKGALIGWLAKAAELANLADKSVGPASDKYSELHAQALKQIALYERLGGTGVEVSKSRTVIRDIRRWI